MIHKKIPINFVFLNSPCGLVNNLLSPVIHVVLTHSDSPNHKMESRCLRRVCQVLSLLTLCAGLKYLFLFTISRRPL